MNTTIFLGEDQRAASREAKQALDRAVKALISPDEQFRRAAVHHFMRLSHQIVRHKLLDRLIALTAVADESVHRRATDSLVDAGPYAVSLLVYRLGKARKPEVQLRLAALVARAGRQLSPLDVMIFRPALELVRRKTGHEGVRTAVARAIDKLGSADRIPGLTGPDGATDSGSPHGQEVAHPLSPTTDSGRTDPR